MDISWSALRGSATLYINIYILQVWLFDGYLLVTYKNPKSETPWYARLPVIALMVICWLLQIWEFPQGFQAYNGTGK